MIDISIIGKNRSINECIDYCNKRGIITEFVDDPVNAKGDFICIIDPLIYYEPYFLHIQWVALHVKNITASEYIFKKCVCYYENEFYIGDFSGCNKFYRANSKKRQLYIEDNILAGCTRYKLEELPVMPPSDKHLVKYHNYFKSI